MSQFPAEIDTEEARCPVCGPAGSEPRASRPDLERRTSARAWTFRRCNYCNLVFLDPRPTAAASRAFEGLPAALEGLRDAGEDLAIARIVEHVGAAARVALAAERDSRVASELERRIANVVRVELEELASVGERFDAALVVDALERTRDPQAAVVALRGALVDGAPVAFVGTDVAGAEEKRFRARDWAGYDAPRKLYLFNPFNLSRLTGAAGFDLVARVSLPAPRVAIASWRHALAARGVDAVALAFVTFENPLVRAWFTWRDRRRIARDERTARMLVLVRARPAKSK